MSTSVASPNRIAKAATEIGAPWTWNIVGPVSVGVATQAPGWGILSALSMGVLPMIGILAMSARGTTSSHHVPERARRPHIALGILIMVAAVLAAMIIADVTGLLLAVQSAGLTAIVVLGVVSRYWQISFHATVSIGWTLAAWWLTGWPLGLLCTALSVAVCWSRWTLGAHTVAQLLAGGALGGASFGVAIGFAL